MVKIWIKSLKGEKEGSLELWKKMDDMDRRKGERMKLNRGMVARVESVG